MIVASSSSVYGANPTLPKREDLATVPLSPYAASKLATEGYVVAYQHCFGAADAGVPLLQRVRPAAGPGHAYAAVVPAFVDAALAGRPLTVHGDGRQSRDFTYVGTVAAVLTRAVVDTVTSPTPVNLAFGSRTDLLGVIALLEQLLGHPVEVDHVEPRPGDVRHSQADDTLLRSLFAGLEPVDLATGLQATIDWFRATGSYPDLPAVTSAWPGAARTGASGPSTSLLLAVVGRPGRGARRRVRGRRCG